MAVDACSYRSAVKSNSLELLLRTTKDCSPLRASVNVLTQKPFYQEPSAITSSWDSPIRAIECCNYLKLCKFLSWQPSLYNPSLCRCLLLPCFNFSPLRSLPLLLLVFLLEFQFSFCKQHSGGCFVLGLCTMQIPRCENTKHDCTCDCLFDFNNPRCGISRQTIYYIVIQNCLCLFILSCHLASVACCFYLPDLSFQCYTLFHDAIFQKQPFPVTTSATNIHFTLRSLFMISSHFHWNFTRYAIKSCFRTVFLQVCTEVGCYGVV